MLFEVGGLLLLLLFKYIIGDPTALVVDRGGTMHVPGVDHGVWTVVAPCMCLVCGWFLLIHWPKG